MHNKKKREKELKEIRSTSRAVVPPADNEERPVRNRAAQRRVNHEGFEVTTAMENYVEKKLLGGLIYLRKYDRIDLIFGLFKDVDRDLVR